MEEEVWGRVRERLEGVLEEYSSRAEEEWNRIVSRFLESLRTLRRRFESGGG